MATVPETDQLWTIPLPRELRRKAGAFILTPDTVVVADPPNRQNGTYLRNLINPPTGFPLPIQADAAGSTKVIRLETCVDQETLGHEGYRLDVSPDALRIEAAEPRGVFYGIQTLRQLLPAAIEKRTLVRGMNWQIPCLIIKDLPRFHWRGFMLDEARHFFGKATVLRYLDLLALHKLNIFHWHLTDDQGWRIEIKGYPRLAEIGAVRKGTTRGLVGKHDGIPHRGFYTQREIKEIVAYAADRHITIVPEIEMPGHSLAALAAYPELSCTGGPFEVATRFGPFRDVFCVGKQATLTFLRNVLDEVMALFPGPFIHTGGDEVLKGRWKRCPDCQRRIAEEGLGDQHGLQLYLTNQIAHHLAANGRRLIGWNQILRDGLDKGAVVQYWTGNGNKVIQAMRDGRKVIRSPFTYLYLDHSYSLTPLSKAYEYEPVSPDPNPSEAAHVLGLEAPLWTEFVRNQARLDYQTFPRLSAFAETGWSSKEHKELEYFSVRLSVLLERLDVLGVKYAPSADWEPPWFKRMVGLLTILQPQTKTAP